jgi:hypothetical protein
MDWMIGFIDTLYTVLGTTGNYSAIADLHTLQFTVTHALEFSVFTSRILATDLSVCHFKSHMKSSLHRVIPFLQLFCNCQFRRFDSIQFLCPKLISWQASVSKLDSILNSLYNARTTQKYSLSIVGKAFLQRCCIAMEVTRLSLTYSLPRECVYRVVAW